MTRPKLQLTFLFILLTCVTLTSSLAQSTDQGQGADDTVTVPQSAQERAQEALEAQRLELGARENVLAEIKRTLQPQIEEAQRQRTLLNQQMAVLDSQREALRAQEEALEAQENVTPEQRDALELQREAFGAQQRALRGQIEEVRALEAALAPQRERVAALEAEVQTLRQGVAQAEQRVAQQREAAQQLRQNLLETLLVALEDNPRYRAAQAAVDAAEAQLSAAYDPASLQLQGAYNTTAIDDAAAAPQAEPLQQPETPEEGGQIAIPTNTTQLSANATFRPFPFGDTRDLVQQQELALESAVLDFREAVTGLERQAIEATLQFQLAQQSLGLVRNALQAAQSALNATWTRFDRGAANERELRDARANFRQAEISLENAQADLELARLSLRSLNLDSFIQILERRANEDISAFLDLPRVDEGLPLAVQRSQISLAQSAIGVGTAYRDLIPVAQASYNYNLDDNSSLNASIESRTLQPSVGYSYRDPGRSPPESAVVSSFQVGVTADISFGVFDQISASESQRTAAEAGLEATREDAQIQNASLLNTLNQAERNAELERLQFRNAQQSFAENQQRQELGLITPLETQQALIELLEADLELRQARLSALQALLDTYGFYALPPSEVLQ